MLLASRRSHLSQAAQQKKRGGGLFAHFNCKRPPCTHVCIVNRCRQNANLSWNVDYFLGYEHNAGPGPIPDWWIIDEGPGRIIKGYSPRQRRCRLLGIWGEKGLRVKPPTGSEDESDTALLCCTQLGHRPLRRFREEGGCCFCWEERCCRGWRRITSERGLNTRSK